MKRTPGSIIKTCSETDIKRHPLLSIIVPVYNVAPYLERCLQSLLEQTEKDLEIVCVEDGSTDESPAILRGWLKRDPRLRIISQPNAGLSAARNTGLKAAAGRYIGFVDSDDWVDPAFFEHLLRAAEESGADVVKTDHQGVCSVQAAKPPLYRQWSEVTQWPDKLLHNSAWQKLYRHDFLKRHQLSFPNGLKWEDVLWTLQVMNYAHTVVYRPAGAYYYFANAQGICSLGVSSKKEEMQRHTLEIMRRCLLFAQEQNFSPKCMRQTKQYLARTLLLPRTVVRYQFSHLLKIRRMLGSWLTLKALYRGPNGRSFVWVQTQNFHGNDYHVLNVLNFKIRLWKRKITPLKKTRF